MQSRDFPSFLPLSLPLCVSIPGNLAAMQCISASDDESISCRAADVVKQYPNAMVMVDHCGLPYVRDEPTMKLWREGRYLLYQLYSR